MSHTIKEKEKAKIYEVGGPRKDERKTRTRRRVVQKKGFVLCSMYRNFKEKHHQAILESSRSRNLSSVEM